MYIYIYNTRLQGSIHMGGFYFVRVMNFHGEFLLQLNGTTSGCNSCFAPLKQATPTIVPFSVSVLAVVTNKVETAMYL